MSGYSKFHSKQGKATKAAHGKFHAGAKGSSGGDDEKTVKPPEMQRSVGQLASSYAPMRHFAFENGLGICLASPVPSNPIPLAGNTPDQIHRRLHEAARAWFVEGSTRLAAKDPIREDKLRHLIVDESLFDPGNRVFEYRRDVFGFVEPKRMGYEIAPTTLVCGTCGLLKPCSSAARMEIFLNQAEKECQDPQSASKSTRRCRWRQFEPIFVHPSGAWRSVDVKSLEMFPGATTPSRFTASCESCGHQQFKVDMSKVTLSGWYLKCAKCGVKTGWNWTDNDEEYLRVQARGRQTGEDGVPTYVANPDDARMEKISYGAAIAYIPQSETFVDLPHADVLRLTEAVHMADLCDFIGSRAGYFAKLPLPAQAALELAKGGAEAQAISVRITRNLAAAAGLRQIDAELAEQQQEEAEKAVREACDKKFLKLDINVPDSIRMNIAERSQKWASRYDPFQLIIEHAALEKTKLSMLMDSGRPAFVRFVDPDEQLGPWKVGTAEADEGKKKVYVAFSKLGILQAGLIPKFELCRFTYGYSRTSSGPVHPKRDIPVRLKLFPKTQVHDQPDTVHPIYVMRQKNEAFYFRLDEGRVREWLVLLGCEDSILLNEPSLVASLLQSARPMNRFLTEHDQQPAMQPKIYSAVYALLHSMAHHVIRTMSRLSGLDEGGLGEYLFPADLAFVVYRSGMTMDLGDLSSLWRNSWEAFLNELVNFPDSLGCNVGSLCAEQGAACPDCLMIPEVTCIAGNRYLSRSLLTGEGHPSFMDMGGRRVTGYLELAGNAPLASI